MNALSRGTVNGIGAALVLAISSCSVERLVHKDANASVRLARDIRNSGHLVLYVHDRGDATASQCRARRWVDRESYRTVGPVAMNARDRAAIWDAPLLYACDAVTDSPADPPRSIRSVLEPHCRYTLLLQRPFASFDRVQTLAFRTDANGKIVDVSERVEKRYRGMPDRLLE
ncbi:MAG TPA: hypothetical protein PLB89_01555 [Flavobacteriales bacterium]|nr:hypothetical protein [Flavobacteriales bacterium]